jgi:hypothetical protein
VACKILFIFATDSINPNNHRMKKLFILGCMMLGLTASAQVPLIEHVGGSVGVGTTGITVDVAARVTSYFGIRAGVDIMPQIKINKDLNLGVDDKSLSIQQMSAYIDQLNQYLPAADQIDKSILPNGELPRNLDIQGKLSNTTGHVLIDVYPFGPVNGFHATIGAYFGGKKVVKVYNREAGALAVVNQWNNAMRTAQNNPTGSLNTQVVQPYGLKMIGAELGDYFITPDPAENGDVEASIQVSGFRPYIGLGFGRCVPNMPLGYQVDFGVQFWNTPKIYAPSYAKSTDSFIGESQLDESKVGGDASGVIKTITKISVYPSITIRLTGKFF